MRHDAGNWREKKGKKKKTDRSGSPQVYKAENGPTLDLIQGSHDRFGAQ